MIPLPSPLAPPPVYATSEFKKRIKELESKLRGCEQVIADFKKSSSRAQEINRDLMDKIKSKDL